MRPDHQKQLPRGGEVQTETGELLKGPKPLEPSKQTRVLSEGGDGDDRTPDKPIGQIARLKGGDKQQGGAGDPAVSDLEPEKQGGIGGP